MAEEAPSWSELPDDLLDEILRRLSWPEDYLHFSGVCKSWYSFAKSDLSRVSLLMLADVQEVPKRVYVRFFDISNYRTHKKHIPAAKGKRRMESLGWLITVSELEGDIHLLHPFSSPTIEIQLPHQNTTEQYDIRRTPYPYTFVHKAVLSGSPSLTEDFVLMIIEGNNKSLSFWCLGDTNWTRINEGPVTHSPYSDLVYFNNRFYVVDYSGRVFVCSISGEHTTEMVARLGSEYAGEQYYLVESLPDLYLLVRHGVAKRDVRFFPDGTNDRIPMIVMDPDWEDEDQTYGTTGIQVFRVDLAAHTMTRTRELGDRAFFIGHSASRSIQASRFRGIQPNHIYFTDDYWPSYINYLGGGGFDMGALSLADDTIQLFFPEVSVSAVSPPTWVTPTLGCQL